MISHSTAAHFHAPDDLLGAVISPRHVLISVKDRTTRNVYSSGSVAGAVDQNSLVRIDGSLSQPLSSFVAYEAGNGLAEAQRARQIAVHVNFSNPY